MGIFSSDDDVVSESTRTRDISRANTRITALENRLRLIEEAIAESPELVEHYRKARARMAERNLKDNLSGSGW